MKALTKFLKLDDSLDVLANPFKQNCIHVIHIHLYRTNMTARVEFQNGDTRGEQNFKADNFNSLIKRIGIFLESLEE